MISTKKYKTMTIDEQEKLFEPYTSCSICEGKIDEEHFINKKLVCSDCYYSEFDKVLTEHPIWHPRLLKG